MLEQLGPYLIDEQIGRGGMGFVYSARHEETDEQVAVKTLLNAFADDDTFRDRFHQQRIALTPTKPASCICQSTS